VNFKIGDDEEASFQEKKVDSSDLLIQI